MGNIYNPQRKHKEAMLMHKKLLKVQLSNLRCHPTSTAKLYGSLSQTYFLENSYEETVLMLKKSIKIQQSVFGLNHVNIANSYNYIGSIYLSQSKHNDAISMNEKTLKFKGIWRGVMKQCLSISNRSNIKIFTYGYHHSAPVAILNSMGAVLVNQGKYDDTLCKYEKLLKT
ncbi:Kinesin light chain 4 [Trichoplax sp. H2]|nr:Kinesin light chain 4 [Trichoplax sp. H2]|eukprot:RDD39623.1 Kinesin light chain 4 [Trichoplax sp. H2]